MCGKKHAMCGLVHRNKFCDALLIDFVGECWNASQTRSVFSSFVLGRPEWWATFTLPIVMKFLCHLRIEGHEGGSLLNVVRRFVWTWISDFVSMNQATHHTFSRTFSILYCSNDSLANLMRSAATCQKKTFSYCILCIRDCWCNFNTTCFIACLSCNIPFGTLCRFVHLFWGLLMSLEPDKKFYEWV
jgi:hypothetical protein